MFRSLVCWRDRTVDLMMVTSCGCTAARRHGSFVGPR